MHCHTHAASRPNQAPTTTHAPACEQHTGHQQKKGTSDARGKYQTPDVQVQPSLDSVNTTKGSVSGPHSPHKRIQKPGKRSIRQLMHCHTHAASRLNQAPTTAHAPACGQHTGHHIDVDVDGGDDVDVDDDGGDDDDGDDDGGEDVDVDVDGGDDVDVDVDGGDDFDVDVDGGDDFDVDVDGGDDADGDVFGLED